MGTARIKPFFLTAMLLFLLAPSSTWGFQISPCLRILTYKPGELGQDPINLYNQCALFPQKTGLAVHEHLTNFAVDEYRGHGFIRNAQALPMTHSIAKQKNEYRRTQNDWYVRNPERLHSTSDLIYGSWWNDDPLMLLWGEGGDLYTGSKAFAKFFDGLTQSHYPGGVKYCKVPRAQSLGWNTHFGTLQHLHFMSETAKADTTTDRIDDTLGKSLEWIEYAYKVATLKIAFDAKLTSEDLAKLHLPSIVANLCLKDDKYVTVRTLFSRVDFQDERRKKMIPDVALGSIFHVLQDSFSPAHTCRVEEAVNGKQYAALIEVYNYNDQVKEKNGKENHTKLDIYPQWLLDYSRTGVHKYENDPVSVGAWLLDAVDTGKEWPEVRDHLLNTVFKKASSQRLEGISCIGT